ncbi:MAG TPA: alpha/beta hydrolase [Pseudonocardiaceae bacterium]|nr:alpha/beta hydrolase [Pseudonocardiaceae bacterium]
MSTRTGRSNRSRRSTLLAVLALIAGLTGIVVVAVQQPASAGATTTPPSTGSPVTPVPTIPTTSTNPDQRGPDPTEASIEAAVGPFGTAELTVPAGTVSGFGGGTVYYPTDTSQGTFGAAAIAPGLNGGQPDISWYGPRLASQGFVVFTIDTLTLTDSTGSRAAQLGAALRYLTSASGVKDRVDPHRLAVLGHSYGGGGALEAANAWPVLKAAIALAPWDNPTATWATVKVPTLVVGAQDDIIAPPANYARPFYQTLPTAGPKAYLEIAGGSHVTPTLPNTTIAKVAIAWLKRFVDNDTRYNQFLWPPSNADNSISAYWSISPK